MKTIKRLITLIFAVLGVLCGTGQVKAITLTIYADPSTGTYEGYDFDDLSNGQLTVANYTVIAPIPPYNTTYVTNRYFAGRFDVVVVENYQSPFNVVAGPLSCNNVCYIDLSATRLYVLSNGYNGTGNGVNGLVNTMAAFENGDVYFGGEFPSAGNQVLGGAPEDWIHWIPWNLAGTGAWSWKGAPEPLTTGIVPYIAGFSTNLFSCPSDYILPKFRQNPKAFGVFGSVPVQQYPFSYTLSSPGEPLDPQGPSMRTHGMASDFVPYRRGRTWAAPFRSASIRNPAEKIMFADETMAYEMRGGDWIFPPGQNSGWCWPYDKVTVRHSGAGSVACADGHEEMVRPAYWTNPVHYDPLR